MVRYSELKGQYELEKTIGCGGFAKVKLATHLATGERVAIKIMDKAVLGDDLPRVKLELNALKSISHQHICRLYQVVETETHFFLVMEYCAGGELFDHIVEKTKLTESESRIFFRQIVSAVAYLHSLGYAHRDLKPENVLLDKDQNLKLIDFGLCARPDGGMKSLLFTSCGSPTYAAPELVLGKEYLGPEVDVWAMGVLLYALLAGALPFDDLNIDSLYKKILSGRYQEPPFLSSESKKLIKAMLQVDPKKRITITQLLSHQWLTLGFLEPVIYRSTEPRTYDGDCIKTIATYADLTPLSVWDHVKKWEYDYCTATYFLLLSKKKRGSTLKLHTLTSHVHLKPTIENTNNNKIRNKRRSLKPLRIKEGRKADPETPRTPYYDCVSADSDSENARPFFNCVDGGEQFSTPVNRFVTPPPVGRRKSQKRTRSPTSRTERSPVPVKKVVTRRSSSGTPDSKAPVSAAAPDTPGSARRVLGSIERSFNMVRHVLTPKKAHREIAAAAEPVVLSSKNLCNVSTTQCKDPEHVITELARAFQKKGFSCCRKGFILKGEVGANVLHHCAGCSFELEICYLPRMGPKNPNRCDTPPPRSILKNGPLKAWNGSPGGGDGNSNPSTPTRTRNQTYSKLAMDLFSKDKGKDFDYVGIRRKRLKGDSWCYKKVCEEVLAVATKDLRQVTESLV